MRFFEKTVFALLCVSFFPQKVFSHKVLYPWGPTNGDAQILASSESKPYFDLNHPVNLKLGTFTFMNTTGINSLFINKQGIIHFRQNATFFPYTSLSRYKMQEPALLPLFGEIDPQRGSVYFRETRNKTILQQATMDVKSAFPFLKGLSMDWALIVTWTDIRFWEPSYYHEGNGSSNSNNNCNCTKKVNELQAVITSALDGGRTFVIYNYGKITWAENPISGWEGSMYMSPYPEVFGILEEQEVVRNASFAGFNIQEGGLYRLKGTETLEGILNLTSKTNVSPPSQDKEGRFVFRVDNLLSSSSCDYTGIIEQVRVIPASVCVLGNVPVRIRGPCLRNAKNVVCKWHEDWPMNSTRAALTTTGTVYGKEVECPVPLLHTTNGRVKVELAFMERTEEMSYSGWVTTYAPPEEPKGWNSLELQITPNGEIKTSWNPRFFSPSDKEEERAALLLQLYLVVVDFLDEGVKVEAVVQMAVFNAGSYSGSLTAPFFRGKPRTGYFLVLTNIQDRSKDVLEESDLLALHSQVVFPSIAISKEEGQSLCEKWNKEDPGVPMNLSACPTLLSQAYSDWTFMQEPLISEQFITFKERVSSGLGSCQRCSYTNMPGGGRGILLVPPSSGAAFVHSSCLTRNYLEHVRRDLLPLFWCRMGGSVPGEYQRLFWEKRATRTGTGVGWLPPTLSWWRGDPHITTWDGVTVSFNPVGEFWLVRDQGGFSAQGRMSRFKSKNASVFTAFAIEQVGRSSVHLQVGLAGTGLRIWLNKEEIEVSSDNLNIMNASPGEEMKAESTIVVEGATLTLQKQRKKGLVEFQKVTGSFRSGYSFEINAMPDDTKSFFFLNVIALAAPSLRGSGRMRGILGDFDGDQKNDLKTRSGDRTMNPTLEQVHRWGLTWRTTPEESIFAYFGGQTHETFQNVDFVPNLKEPNASNTFPRNVVDVCGNVRECYFDYSTTGDISVAEATMEIQTRVDQIQEIFGRKPRPVPCTSGGCEDTTYSTTRKTTAQTVTDSHGQPVTTKKPSKGNSNLRPNRNMLDLIIILAFPFICDWFRSY